MFHKKRLTFIRPLKLIHMELKLDLKEHKFRHNFADTLNLLCSCSLETEDTEYYFLRSQNNL